MINWSIGFINNYKQIFLDSSFVFAFCGLIVSTFFDIAFHGLLRIRLAGGKNHASLSDSDSGESESLKKWRADYAAGRSSLDPDKLGNLFNNF